MVPSRLHRRQRLHRMVPSRLHRRQRLHRMVPSRLHRRQRLHRRLQRRHVQIDGVGDKEQDEGRHEELPTKDGTARLEHGRLAERISLKLS